MGIGGDINPGYAQFASLEQPSVSETQADASGQENREEEATSRASSASEHQSTSSSNKSSLKQQSSSTDSSSNGRKAAKSVQIKEHTEDVSTVYSYTLSDHFLSDKNLFHNLFHTLFNNLISQNYGHVSKLIIYVNMYS